MDVFRLELSRRQQRLNRFGVAFHGSQRLAAEKENMSLQPTGVIDPIERAEHSLRNPVAAIRTTRPAFAKGGDQIQIAFRFAEDLLTADSRWIGHRRGPRLQKSRN